MIGQTSVKKPATAGALVGVIASSAALARATRLLRPPDLFELRLDALRGSLGEVARAIPRLRAPLILTARHPAEGGLGRLNLAARRALLLRFLEHAAFVDLELRSVRQMKMLVAAMRRQETKLLLSFHDFQDTPAVGALCRKLESAEAASADIFKVATRADTPAQLARLVSFLATTRSTLPVAAMGMGKLGLASRLQLGQLGSALTYVSLGQANTEGQPSFNQLRRTWRAYTK